jgi:hypothetical protein
MFPTFQCSLSLTKLKKGLKDIHELPSQQTAEDKALVWKQDLRIVPLCAAIYLLCYLDRSNIGMLPI